MKTQIIKRAILALMMAVMAVTAATASAYDFDIDGIYYNALTHDVLRDYGTVEVTYKDKNYNSYSGSVTIPSYVYHNFDKFDVVKIGDDAFRDCDNLTSVTFGGRVTEIGESAFQGCTGLTSVTISSSVTEIGTSAFRNCSGLTSVTIPNSVTSIGVSAFYGCTGLTSVKISDIASWCNINFNSNNYDNQYSNPLYYAHHLYLGYTEITNLVIPNSVTRIRGYAFYGCTGLKSVTIGNSVTSIGDYAFYGCTGLTSVTIGNSVTAILKSPFYGCDNITTLTSYAEAPPVCTTNALFSIDKTRCTLYVPAESIELYRTISPWKEFKNIKATNNAGIEDIVVDDDNADCPTEVYSIQGVKVGDSTDGLAPGTYIVKQGRSITKQVIQ